MPLEDRYQVEKFLKDLATAIAEGITEHFLELGKNQTTGFVLYVVDYNTGTFHFISDMDIENRTKMIKAHLAREVQ